MNIDAIVRKSREWTGDFGGILVNFFSPYCVKRSARKCAMDKEGEEEHEWAKMNHTEENRCGRRER